MKRTRLLILIVDDNATNRKLLRAILEAERFKVVEAADGLEALEQLEHEPIVTIISDILMPRMDGYRLCHEVRKSNRWSVLPFIMYSSTYASASDEKLALDLGADRFIRKPASSKTIIEAVMAVMEGSIRVGPPPLEAPAELAVMQEYSERLVAKLEEKCLALEQRNKELQASEERYRALSETAHDIIFTTDRAGVIQYINRHGAKQLGRPVEEIIGKTQSELFPPAIGESNQAALGQVFASGQPLYDERQLPFQDHEVWVGTWLVPLKEAGHDTAVMGIARDITDRKRADQLRSSVALSFSHELNTPLTGILGFLEVIRSGFGGLSREELRETIEEIHGSAQRLRRLVERNVDYSALELSASDPSGPSRLARPQTNESRAFAQTLAQQIALEHERSGDLKLDLADSMCPMGSRYLARLLAELLDNAFKFSHAGSPVALISRATADTFELAVQDAGRGMKPEEIAAIGAFIQFDRDHYEQQGVGLGLHLAKRITELHGGKFSIESAPGSGTRVTVSIPRKATVQP